MKATESNHKDRRAVMLTILLLCGFLFTGVSIALSSHRSITTAASEAACPDTRTPLNEMIPGLPGSLFSVITNNPGSEKF